MTVDIRILRFLYTQPFRLHATFQILEPPYPRPLHCVQDERHHLCRNECLFGFVHCTPADSYDMEPSIIAKRKNWTTCGSSNWGHVSFNTENLYKHENWPSPSASAVAAIRTVYAIHDLNAVDRSWLAGNTFMWRYNPRALTPSLD